MLALVWGPTDERLDVVPTPEECLEVGDDRVVVVGRYRGSVRGTGAPLDAAFAHLLRIRDDRIAELIQITDTALWRDALAA